MGNRLTEEERYMREAVKQAKRRMHSVRCRLAVSLYMKVKL